MAEEGLHLSDEDRQLLQSFLPTGLQPTFEGDLRQFPRRVWVFSGGGGYGESVLAALAVTILGGGTLIVLKAFLQSIGSELGKEFVKRWKPRTTEPAGRSEPGLIVLCELRPKLIAVMRLDSSALDQRHSAELLEKIERLQAELSPETEAVIWVEFDPVNNRWSVERQHSAGAGVLYYSADGKKLIHY